MKKYTHSVLLLLCFSMVCWGCTLKDIVEHGDPCISAEYYIQKDSTKHFCNDSDEPCQMIADGFCPPDYSVCAKDTQDVSYCHELCGTGFAFCNQKCWPTNSSDFCGARGECNSDDSNSPDWHGSVCSSFQKCDGNTCIGDCPAGMHEESGLCKTDNNQNCGSNHIQCKTNEICAQGECIDNAQCKDVICNGSCIDPKTSLDYCGADASCSEGSYTACQSGQTCLNGKCQCADGYRLVDGHCEQTCQKGDKKCVNDTQIAVCQGGIWKESACESPQVCSNGVCVLESQSTPCTEGTIDCNGNDLLTCVNSIWEKTDCVKQTGGIAAKCENGACQVTQCATGEHPSGDKKRCIKDIDECGTKKINCFAQPEWEGTDKGECRHGKCVPIECKDDYQLYQYTPEFDESGDTDDMAICLKKIYSCSGCWEDGYTLDDNYYCQRMTDCSSPSKKDTCSAEEKFNYCDSVLIEPGLSFDFYCLEAAIDYCDNPSLKYCFYLEEENCM
ncbi:MAG: hypothetical protein J6A01_07750 [Proteobacteria bacterium]|nr:hypothetical protein [Pseudomonadota bacterium]